MVVPTSFLTQVMKQRQLVQRAYLKQAPERAQQIQEAKLERDPIQRYIHKEIIRRTVAEESPAPSKPKPLSPLEILSPAYLMFNRSLSPAGVIATALSRPKVQKERLIDFAGAIGAVTPEGEITETGKDIAHVGTIAETTGGLIGKAADTVGKAAALSPALLIGGALIIGAFLLKR